MPWIQYYQYFFGLNQWMPWPGCQMGSAMGEAAGKPSAIACVVAQWLSAHECNVPWLGAKCRLKMAAQFLLGFSSSPHNAIVDVIFF